MKARVALTTIDRQTFCLYCQQEFGGPGALAEHIMRRHPTTYAAERVVRRVRLDGDNDKRKRRTP